jgi:hypothetical protein
VTVRDLEGEVQTVVIPAQSMSQVSRLEVIQTGARYGREKEASAETTRQSLLLKPSLPVNLPRAGRLGR